MQKPTDGSSLDKALKKWKYKLTGINPQRPNKSGWNRHLHYFRMAACKVFYLLSTVHNIVLHS